MTTSKAFPAVTTAVFDLDGALIDSDPIISACLRTAFAEMGLPHVTPERLRAVVGPPLTEGIRAILAENGRDLALTQACVARYRELFREAAPNKTPLQAGIARMLQRLGGRVTLGIATSKPRELALPILAGLGLVDMFTVIAGPELDTPAESKGQTLNRALEQLGLATEIPVDRARTIMVGDRKHDVAGAHAAGVFAVAVTWGYGSREELAEAGADAIFDAPEALTAAILGARHARA